MSSNGSDFFFLSFGLKSPSLKYFRSTNLEEIFIRNFLPRTQKEGPYFKVHPRLIFGLLSFKLYKSKIRSFSFYLSLILLGLDPYIFAPYTQSISEQTARFGH